MSQENVEIVRRMVNTFNEQGIEAVASEFLALDVEFHEPPEQPGARVARGREETVEFFTAFDEAWETHRSDPEEIRAVGAEQVLLLSVERFLGRDGIEVAQPAGSIVALRTAKWCAGCRFGSGKRPSKPPGLRSRRCRKRTFETARAGQAHPLNI